MNISEDYFSITLKDCGFLEIRERVDDNPLTNIFFYLFFFLWLDTKTEYEIFPFENNPRKFPKSIKSATHCAVRLFYETHDISYGLTN